MTRLVALLMLAVCAVSSACGGASEHVQDTKLAADFSGSGPGTLDDAHILMGVESRLANATSLSARITYTSTSGIDDSHPEVTAAVFVPRGTPPRVVGRSLPSDTRRRASDTTARHRDLRHSWALRRRSRTWSTPAMS
jgi:hypothetical protein